MSPAGPIGSRPLNTLSTVLAIFQDHLPTRTVGPDDDLFALGVDSLTAVRLGLDLERRFGVAIPPESFVSAPSPSAMAAWIEAQAQERPEPE